MVAKPSVSTGTVIVGDSERCEACERSRGGAPSGRYRMTCVQCCVRLVLSAYPSKGRAASMLALIERQGAVDRALVLDGVRAALPGKSVPPPGGTGGSLLKTRVGRGSAHLSRPRVWPGA